MKSLALVLFLSVHTLWAGPGDDAPKKTAVAAAKPAPAAPPVTTIDSSLASYEAAAPKSYYTNAVKGIQNPYVSTGQDLSDIEKQMIKDQVEGKGIWAKIPKNKRVLINERYHSDVPGITEQMLAASKEFALTRWVLDGNDYLEGDFAAGDKTKFRTDYGEMKTKSTAMGKTLQKYLDAGFKWGDSGKAQLVSQPVYNKEGDKITPIMHHKTLLQGYVGDDGKIKIIQAFSGSGNQTANTDDVLKPGDATPITRINRGNVITDPDLLNALKEHNDALVTALSKGGEVSDVNYGKRVRVNYKNGDYAEVAFTDGKYNPNDRIEEFLRYAIAHPNEVKPKRILFNQFVGMTDRSVYEAIVDAMKVFPDLKVEGMFDNKFAPIKGWGMTPNLMGFDAIHPFGRLTFGVGEKVGSRVDLKVYQRPINGKHETDPDGPPTDVYVDHEKMTKIDYEGNDGAKRSRIWDLSFNLSNASRNAETQMEKDVATDSNVAKSYDETVLGTIAQEKEFAIDGPVAILRQEVARLTGHSIYEIDVSRLEKIKKMILDRDIKGLKAEFEKLAGETTHLKERPTNADMQANIDRLMGFLEWHAREMPGVYKQTDPEKFPFRLRRVLSVAETVMDKEMTPGMKKSVIRSAMWEPMPGKSDLEMEEALEARVQEAWKVLKIAEPFPVKTVAATAATPPPVSQAADCGPKMKKAAGM